MKRENDDNRLLTSGLDGYKTELLVNKVIIVGYSLQGVCCPTKPLLRLLILSLIVQ